MDDLSVGYFEHAHPDRHLLSYVTSIFITSIAHRIKNPLRRTSEHIAIALN